MSNTLEVITSKASRTFPEFNMCSVDTFSSVTGYFSTRLKAKIVVFSGPGSLRFSFQTVK